MKDIDYSAIASAALHNDEIESDQKFRGRIIDAYGMWGAFCSVVLESSGKALDECGAMLGLTRLGTSDGVPVTPFDDMPTIPHLRVTRYGAGDQCPECGSHDVGDFDLSRPGNYKHCMSPIADGCGAVWEVKQ